MGRDGTADVGDDGTETRAAGAGPTNGGNTHTEQKLAEIDDVLKSELLSLGLLDESARESKLVYRDYPESGITNPLQSQDKEDEISKELRRVQQELQRQVIANQKRRLKLVPLIEKAMIEQREERREIERIAKLEDECTKELVRVNICQSF